MRRVERFDVTTRKEVSLGFWFGVIASVSLSKLHVTHILQLPPRVWPSTQTSRMRSFGLPPIIKRASRGRVRGFPRKIAFSTESRRDVADFECHSAAFGHRSTTELIRSLLIFRLCGWKWLVDRSDSLLSVAQRTIGRNMTEFVLRHSFFAQFCGGEDEKDIAPTIAYLNRHGVGGILDYAAEADVSSPSNDGEHENKVVARTYDYTSESQCDANADIFRTCIRSVRNVTPDGFAAIKVTALGDPQLLRRVAALKVETMNLFAKFDKDGNGVLTRDEFLTGYDKYFLSEEGAASDMFDTFTSFARPEKNDLARTERTLDLVDWKRFLSARDVCDMTRRCRHAGPLRLATLSTEELDMYDQMYLRLDSLASLASDLGVRLMIDAEQTYFQPAIDSLVLRLQRKYNRDACTIFNTYQSYLKDSSYRLNSDVERSKRENFRFAAKLVRGAYMYAERDLALENGVESPIHDSMDDTHASFDRNLEAVLNFIKDNEGAYEDTAPAAELMIATHNSRSVKFAVRCMSDAGIDPMHGGVYFGQLLGMADNITFPLGAGG